MTCRATFLVLVLIPFSATAAEPHQASAPQSKPQSASAWSWDGCQKSIESSMVIRCDKLTMRIGRLGSATPPSDEQLLQTEQEALKTTSVSFAKKYPSLKGAVREVTLDFGSGKKAPHSVLSFPETKETNALTFHAFAIPATVEGKHFITVYSCTSKVDADCTAALIDVVTKGPPKI